MLRKFFVTAAVVAVSQSLIAQEEVKEEEKKPTTTITGFADTYFRYDFNQNKSNNLTSFTNSHNSFELGMASLKIEHNVGKIGMVADLGFGKRAQEFSYNETGIVAAIKQLYVTYQATEWLKLTMGSWATHVGYELVDAPANRNYSMSYMFSYGPFFHTGLKADATFGKHGFMVGVSNPTDYKTAPLDSKKSFLAQYSLAITDSWKMYANYVGGTRPSDTAKINQFDLVVTGAISDKFSVGYDGTIFSVKTPDKARSAKNTAQNWWASAVYLNYDPTSLFGITLRSEYYNDQDQIGATSLTTQGASIWANTLSANFRLGGLTLIPEIRIENASKDIYQNKEGSAKGADASVLLAAVYKF